MSRYKDRSTADINSDGFLRHQSINNSTAALCHGLATPSRTDLTRSSNIGSITSRDTKFPKGVTFQG